MASSIDQFIKTHFYCYILYMDYNEMYDFVWHTLGILSKECIGYIMNENSTLGIII